MKEFNDIIQDLRNLMQVVDDAQRETIRQQIDEMIEMEVYQLMYS